MEGYEIVLAERLLRESLQEESRHAGSGRPWAEVAASAYKAYAASTGNKNFRGDPMPAFSDLPEEIRTAWEAAVRQVAGCLTAPPGSDLDEGRWAGWRPSR